jgi:hypothetical protein
MAVLLRAQDNSSAAKGKIMLKRFSLLQQPGFLLKILALLALTSWGLAPANAANFGLKQKTVAVSADVIPPSLFKASPSTLSKSLFAVQDVQVVRSRPVALDLNLLAAAADLPLGVLATKKSLSLNLFDDVSFIADADQIQLTPQGLIWVGTLRGIEQSQVVIVVSGDIVAGNISMPGGRYHIRYIGNEMHEIQKIDPSLFPEDEPPMPAPDLREPQSAFSAPAVDMQADDGSTVDVMVVYSATTRAAAGGSAAMQALINLAIAETNQSYQNSGIGQRLRLVHAEEVAYSETGKILDALRCITSTSDGCLDNIHAIRNTYAADLVSFWVEEGDYCGIANMMRTVSSSFESQGFSAVSRSCATGYYSFGHELGHNMGASHDVYVESSSYPYSYAHGYTYLSSSAPWRTVMAYNDACQAAGKYCTRLQYWSNPVIRYGGIAMGNAAADNHLTLNNTAKTVANFRSSIATPTCGITLSSTSKSVAASATTGTLSVSATSGCLWTAASNVSWISVTSGASGNGSGNISYSVLANSSSSSRIGTLNIAGQTFTVSQTGSASTCTSTALTSTRTLTGNLSFSDCVDANSNGNDYYYDLFSFSGTPGQKLNLSAISNAFDPDLLLVAPDGTTLYNDDAGGGTNPVIATTLNQTGNYQVVLSSALPLETGSYSFSFSIGVTAGGGTLPDLVVSSVSAAAQATVGGLLYMSSTIKNPGLGAAPATSAGIYLSTNRVISTADTDTGFSCAIPALAAGESYSGCLGNVTLPSAMASGTYYLGVYADLDGAIAESNESNNGLAASTTTQVSASSSDASVIEFYHAGLDHYFITADASEVAAVDSGSAGAWARTGYSFKAGGSTPVCRFYGSLSPGPNSHFYTVSAAECAGLKALQASTPDSQKRWNFEGLNFASTPPVSGLCAGGTMPVYRAYNNGSARGIDSNHRISSSPIALQQVVERGWANEGIVMCAPQ